jgi:hypothetical protein
MPRSCCSARPNWRNNVIERWFDLISGFSQDRDDPCGMDGVWLGLRPIASPTVSLGIHCWNDNLKGRAKFIKRNSVPMPVIDIAGYSYGGYAAIELAQHLAKLGLPVRHLILCDAVRRFHVAKWFSLTQWTKLTVPANVQACTYFRQSEDIPAGHRVVAESGRTRLIDGGFLPLGHNAMDEAPEFHAACAAVAGL